MTDAIRERVPHEIDLMYPTLTALKALGGSGHISEIDDAVARDLDLDDDVLAYRKREGQPILYNWCCAWARTHLKNAGAAANTSRGVWTITATGRELGQEDMAGVYKKARSNAAQRKADKGQRDTAQPSDTDPPDQALGSAWSDELLDILQEMPPPSFERLTQLILRESNFSKVEVTGKSGDGGIDGSGVLNVALISFQVLFQCKRFSGSIGANAIRDFRGAMVGRTDKGIFITTGTFTRAAKAEAMRDGAPPIDLIDGGHLCDILKKLGLGVETRQIEQVVVDRGFFETI